MSVRLIKPGSESKPAEMSWNVVLYFQERELRSKKAWYAGPDWCVPSLNLVSLVTAWALNCQFWLILICVSTPPTRLKLTMQRNAPQNVLGAVCNSRSV